MLRPLVCVAMLLAPLLVLGCLAGPSRIDSGHRHIHTDRPSARLLPLPKEDDCFFFAIYGDRTGGKPEGMKVLAQAVADTNLLDPDLVMTVGDLVQGYNNPDKWLPEMREFKSYMQRLSMPWFPVAGNHDIYSAKIKNFRPGLNASLYETHFGPLWYWFRHKSSAFIVLYTDEGDPTTGEVGYHKPSLQRMTPEQLAWLGTALDVNAEMDHIFVFVHHPRWRGGRYGDDWEKVHARLKGAGNVSAVFAGHIHQMVYSGVRDGIEYYALATTGGSLVNYLPQRAGFLHHYNLVTVRKDSFKVTTIPVGAVMDPKLIDSKMNEEVRELEKALSARGRGPLEISQDGSVLGRYEVDLKNPTTRTIEVTFTPTCRDPRWSFSPDHQHLSIGPKASKAVVFEVSHPASGLDQWFDLPRLDIQADYLAPGLRIQMQTRSTPFAVRPPATPARTPKGGHLNLGHRACLAVPTPLLGLAGDRISVECFVRAEHLNGSRAIFSTEGFALSLVDGVLQLKLTYDGKRRSLTAKSAIETGTWHHLATCFGGGSVAIYVDGVRVAGMPASGSLPAGTGRLTLIGADVTTKGAKQRFAGLSLDEFRVSTSVRYSGKRFTPVDRRRGFSRDEDTALLLHLDVDLGPWTGDSSKNQVQALRVGPARCVSDTGEAGRESNNRTTSPKKQGQ